MSNPFLSLLPDSLIAQYNDMIRAVIAKNAVPCRFIYPITAYEDCNCADSVYNASPNPYLKGKKQSGGCALCNGTGKIPVETTESMSICVLFNNKKAQEIVPGVLIGANGDAQTLSETTDTIKIIKTCKAVVFNTDLEYANKNLYVRDGEPQIIGFGNSPKFILTTWKLSG